MTVMMAGLVAIGSIGACSSSSGTDFTGTWTYNAGASGTISCSTGNDTLNFTGNEEFRDGTDSDFVVVSSNGCNIKVNVTGNRADAVPGQSCASTSGGVTTTITFNSLSYTADKDVLSFAAAGTINLMGPNGEATCTLSGSATLHKVSN